MMNNISQISRFSLWAIFAFTLWLNFINWQKDYAVADAVAQAAAEHPPVTALDAVPTGTAASAPAATSAPGAQATAAIAAAAPGSLGAMTQSFSGDVVHVRTDVLDLTLSLKGGTVTQADLPVYAKVKGKAERVRLENHDSADTLYVLETGLYGPAGEARPDQQAAFTADKGEYALADGQEELRVPLRWSAGGVNVTKEYVFRRGSYAVGIEQNINNQSAAAWPVASYAQILRNHIPVHSSLFNPNPERFAFNGPAIWAGKYRTLKVTDEDDAHLSQEVTTGWIAALQHHFVTAVVPPKGVPFRFTMQAQGNEYALAARGPMMLVPAGGTLSLPLTVFVGPKLQAQLATAGPELQRVTDFGHLFFIAQPLFWALSKVYDATRNWGVAILVVTLLLKIVFYPLSEASGKSMAKMRELGPRIKNLQEQYKDDREKLGRATMELYSKEGANPVSGCLPILVQMPVFFAFYWVLQESVEMRQAPFMGWLQDLSSPDPIYILPILMAGAMFVQQRLNPAPADPVQAKVMMFMPLGMSVLFAFLPSGLVLYYVANTVLGVAQQWNINRRIHAAALAKKKI